MIGQNPGINDNLKRIAKWEKERAEALEEAKRTPNGRGDINLCEHCFFHIAECGGNPEFGDGFGGDNVIDCDTFAP